MMLGKFNLKCPVKTRRPMPPHPFDNKGLIIFSSAFFLPNICLLRSIDKTRVGHYIFYHCLMEQIYDFKGKTPC